VLAAEQFSDSEPINLSAEILQILLYLLCHTLVLLLPGKLVEFLSVIKGLFELFPRLQPFTFTLYGLQNCLCIFPVIPEIRLCRLMLQTGYLLFKTLRVKDASRGR
jgi:hypothetical protein